MSALKVCPQCGTEYELDTLFCPKDGTTLRSKNAQGDLIGSIIADRYRVTKKLGEGGMGTVYLAEHVKMGRKSAVKVMNPGMVSDADAISRFNREAQNASRINHANVAAVYDFGETPEGLTYLAMEFIEGPALTKVISELGALPPARAADITRQASEALAVAHDMGIVHRDLKPDNIMLAKGREGADVVKVVDFGIAKAAAEEGQKVTKTGMVVGTPEYMSPEQLSGDKLDGRSDTYSLALVAFNMLTGKLPFPAETAQESMIARLVETPKQLSEMKADVPWTAEVQAVMNKALARDAAERYQTASEFGRELFKAVQHMAHHDVTSAHTAMIGRVSAGAAAAAAPAAKTAVGAKAQVPPTRIGAATPHAPPVVVPPAPVAKSKTGMFAGIGVAVVVLGVGGYIAMNKMNGSGAQGTALLNQANPPAGATGAQTTTPPPPVATDYDALLDSLDKMTEDVLNGTAANAAIALQRLNALQTSTMTSDQVVHAALIRADAHVIRESNCDARKAVLDVEGKAKGTKYEKRVAFIIKNSAC